MLSPLYSQSSPKVMINLLSNKEFNRDWVTGLDDFDKIEKHVFNLIRDYSGKRDDRLRIFHLIQIWGGYSGRNIYLNSSEGFDWDKIDAHYEGLIKACRAITIISEQAIKDLCKAVMVFDENVKDIGISFITKHTRFWLLDDSTDKMLPIYDSVMATDYYKKKVCHFKDLEGYWLKFWKDDKRGNKTLAEYERELYNTYRKNRSQK